MLHPKCCIFIKQITHKHTNTTVGKKSSSTLEPIFFCPSDAHPTPAMNKRKPGYKRPSLVLFELAGWFETLLAVVGALRTAKPNIRENTWMCSRKNFKPLMKFLVCTLKDWKLRFTPPLSYQLDPPPPFTHTHTHVHILKDTQKTHIAASPLAIHERRLIRL